MRITKTSCGIIIMLAFIAASFINASIYLSKQATIAVFPEFIRQILGKLFFMSTNGNQILSGSSMFSKIEWYNFIVIEFAIICPACIIIFGIYWLISKPNDSK